MSAHVLITNHVSSLNKGDESILRVTIDIIKKSLGYKTVIYVLTESPPYNSDPSASVYFLKNPFIAKFSSLTDLNAHIKASAAFLKADAVVVRGGDCLSDVYGQFSLLTHSLSIWPATLLNKPLSFMGHTIGPFTSSGAMSSVAVKLLTKELLESDLIVVRENKSAHVLKQMGINQSNVTIAPDLAFLLKPAPQRQVNEYLSNLMEGHISNMLLGVNTSAIIHRYGFTNVHSEYKKLLSYVNLLAKFLDHIIKKYEISVLFIPHVIMPSNDDRNIANLVRRKMRYRNHTYLIRDNLPPETLKGIIGRVDMLITTRMHPLIHALSMGTPALGIEYSYKTKGLMSPLGLNDYVLNIKTLTLWELIRKFDFMLLKLNDIRKDFREASEKIMPEATEAARLLHNWLRSQT